MKITVCLAILAALAAYAAFAQSAPPAQSSLSFSGFHLNSADPGLQKKFWTGVLGARADGSQAFTLPGLRITVSAVQPGLGTRGSRIDHIGLQVRDLDSILAKAQEQGFPGIARDGSRAMITAPDDLLIELDKDPNLPQPVMKPSIGFYVADIAATRDWYVKNLGATPGEDSAMLPGVLLNFAKTDAPLAGTAGGVLDQIWFGAKGLASLETKLEMSGIQVRLFYFASGRVAQGSASLADPEGTSLEMTGRIAVE